jgi:hypothetical protein
MATKVKTPVNEKFENQDLDLFDALLALDKKDYDYYDRLSDEQKKKFSHFMMIQWMSCIKANTELTQYYVMSSNEAANKHMFNEHVMKHHKLQWLMLCAGSPGYGKQFHQYLPQLKKKVSLLEEPANQKDIAEYFKKIYSNATDSDIKLMASVYTTEQRKKNYIAKQYPNMKFSDIETLSTMIDENDIEENERSLGN